MNPILAQATGFVAMFFNIFSYQRKSAKGIIAFQFLGTVFFALNYLMLGSYIGAMLNVVGMLRGILFLKRDTTHVDRIGWVAVFGIAYIGAYILNFTLLGKEPTVFNLAIEILPVIAMFATHLAYRYESPRILRRFCLISSVSWLIFNVVNVAIGALLCEVFALISNGIAMARLDRKE